MALNMPTFYKRTGSAIVFGAIMLTGLLWDNQWVFIALACLINALCLREYFLLIAKIHPDAYWPTWLKGAFQLITLFLILLFSVHTNDAVEKTFLGLSHFLPLLAPALLFMAALFKKNALSALLLSVGGIFYITVPMMLFTNLRNYSFLIPIALVAMIWINDTMAYIVGSFIGKTPFSPISPKKTWEGTGGGALLTIVAAAIYGKLCTDQPMYQWILLALVTTVAGTLGDLLESKLKRIADVKDSGNIMPGHGGALDRFDSLLIAIPLVFVYYRLFM
jgi:phosphatidate cytidylyltransferase